MSTLFAWLAFPSFLVPGMFEEYGKRDASVPTLFNWFAVLSFRVFFHDILPWLEEEKKDERKELFSSYTCGSLELVDQGKEERNVDGWIEGRINERGKRIEMKDWMGGHNRLLSLSFHVICFCLLMIVDHHPSRFSARDDRIIMAINLRYTYSSLSFNRVCFFPFRLWGKTKKEIFSQRTFLLRRKQESESCSSFRPTLPSFDHHLSCSSWWWNSVFSPLSILDFISISSPLLCLFCTYCCHQNDDKENVDDYCLTSSPPFRSRREWELLKCM